MTRNRQGVVVVFNVPNLVKNKLVQALQKLFELLWNDF